MKVHPDEFAMAREYSNSRDFEHLGPEQIHQVMVRGRELHRWFRAHPRLHAAISLVGHRQHLRGGLAGVRLPSPAGSSPPFPAYGR